MQKVGIVRHAAPFIRLKCGGHHSGSGGVPVQVHERDRYGRFGGVFAGMGPLDGPVRALGFQTPLQTGNPVVTLPSYPNRGC